MLTRWKNAKIVTGSLVYVAGLCMAFRRDILGASNHFGSRNPGMGCNDVRLARVECSYAVQVYRARPSRMKSEMEEATYEPIVCFART